MALQGIYRRMLTGILAVLMVLGLTACGGEDTDHLFFYSTAVGAGTLDPQFATSSTSQLIISNTFEGLMVEDPQGGLLPGVAESYTTSPDGCTYTFILRPDARWSDGSQVTAHDFVFALQRLFGIQAVSPYAANLISIENAGRILAGELPATALGVRAVDDTTLELRLDYPDAALPALLAAPYAAPCREAYFYDQKGKYGVDRSCTLYNGPFKITTMDDTLIRLRRNEQYHSDTAVAAFGVNIELHTEDALELFLRGDNDVVQLSTNQLERVQEGQFIPFEDTTWALVYNQRRSLLGQEEIRLALSAAIDKDTVQKNLEPHAVATNDLIPRSIYLKSRQYRQLAGGLSVLAVDRDLAETLFRTGLQTVGETKLPFTELLVPDTPMTRRIAGGIQGNWQSILHANINVMPLPQEELESRIAAGEFDIALIPLKAPESTPYSMLAQFMSTGSGNVAGWSNPEYDAALAAANAQAMADRSAAAFRACEQQLIDHGVLLPLYATQTHYVIQKNVQGIWIYPNGRIYFKYGQRK